MACDDYISVSFDLDRRGLIWFPEVGDEVCERIIKKKVSILVDPHGAPASRLRQTYVWLPTVEQLILQIEARQGLLYHAGITDCFVYEAVVKTRDGVVETKAPTLRAAFGRVLCGIISSDVKRAVH